MDNAGMLTGKLASMGAAGTVSMVQALCSQLGDEAKFHGNIWPGNISLAPDGSAQLGATSAAPAAERSADQIEYLAPEFFWDNKGSEAADVYSLGLLLYCGATGTMPFRDAGSRDRSVSLRRRMKGERIVVPASVESSLAAVIEKALAFKAEDRYASVAEMLDALNAVNPQPTEPAVPAAVPAAAAPAAPAADKKRAESGKTGKTDYNSRGPVKKAKKRSSPVIPILCGAAVVIIAAVVCVLVLSNKIAAPTETDEPAEVEATSPPYTVVEPETTEAPVAVEDDSEASDEITDDTAVTGSESIDGMDVTQENDTVYVATGNANLRSGPGIAYDIEETLDAGTELQRTGTVNGWSQVQYNGSEYYVSNAVITTDTPEGSDSSDSADSSDSTSSSGSTSSSTSGSTSSSTSGTTSGTTSSSTSGTTSGTTSSSTSGTTSGTTSSSTSSSVNVTAAQGIIIVSSEANLRTGPGTSYSVSTTIAGGSALQYTGTTSEWYRVIWNGNTLYISKTMASEASDTTTTNAVGVLKIASDANIRSGAGTSYSVQGVASAGTTLSITGIVGSKWYRVSYNNGTGYVNRNMVTVTDFAVVNTASGTAKITSEANLRSGPATNFTVLGVGSVGSTYTITGLTDSHWYQISYNGKVAYVAANLVTKQ